MISIVRWLVIILMLVMLWINVRLYLAPATQPDIGEVPKKAVAQLAWIKAKLADGAGEEMQRLFPEGFFFSHALYGLAWVETGLRSADHRDEAVREARWALGRIDSVAGRAVFPADLPPEHGMFYSGWRNHLQAGVVLLSKDETELAQLRSRCDALVEALAASEAWPWMASYHNQVWPCDALPGIHALCVHDKLSGEKRYAEFVARWLAAVSRNLCPDFGMITHVADPGSGRPLGPPRGTSQTVILRFLADIDPEFGSQQYGLFQAHFQDDLLGVPAIREYPHGVAGQGDIDSGPLIGGISASATVVGLGVARIYGDDQVSRSVSQFGEAVGFPIGVNQRRYLGGLLPIGDAFLVHATTARPWIREQSELSVQSTSVSKFWRIGIHLLSLFAGLLLLFAWYKSPRSSPECRALEVP